MAAPTFRTGYTRKRPPGVHIHRLQICGWGPDLSDIANVRHHAKTTRHSESLRKDSKEFFTSSFESASVAAAVH